MSSVVFFSGKELPVYPFYTLIVANLFLIAIYFAGLFKLKNSDYFLSFKSYLWKSVPIIFYIVGFISGYLMR